MNLSPDRFEELCALADQGRAPTAVRLAADEAAAQEKARARREIEALKSTVASLQARLDAAREALLLVGNLARDGFTGTARPDAQPPARSAVN